MQPLARSPSTAAAMAEDEKVKSTDKLLQALDALTQLNQARLSYSLPLTRSSSSSKAGSDAGADAAVVEEARPRQRVSPRLSPTSPMWSKLNNTVDEEEEEEEEGHDSAMIIIIKPRHRLSLMLPFRATSKLTKEHDDDFDDYYDYDDEDDHDAALLETLEVYGERKGITYHGPIRVTSQLGLRRMSCLFSVEVMAAQGMPPAMNGLRLVVAMRRKETRDGAVRTMPARVRLGAADFDEVLCLRCSLYGATGLPASFEPRPFVLSLVAIDAPEMDLGRGAVDLGLFAKEFVEKRGRQWDMAFPLAGKAKGAELVVKLAFQSIDHDGSAEWYTQPAGEDSASLSSLRRSSVSTGRKRRVVPRKLKRSSVVTNPKMTPTETGVPTPELSSSDSFKVDEPETELARIKEVKETQHKELECEPTDESTPVTDVEEALQTESEQEPTDEPTPVAQVEEERQKESEQEPSDQLTPPIEVNKEEQQKEPQCHQTSNEPTTIAEVNGEGQQLEEQIEPEQEPSDEPTPLIEVEEEQEKQEEPELQSADDPTPVTTEVEEEEQQEELVSEPVDEPTPITEGKEEEHREPEREAEDAQEHDYSELPEFNVIDTCDEGQEVKVELEEVARAKKESEEQEQDDANSLIASDEVAKVMANGLEKKSFEVTVPSDVSDVVANTMEPMNHETTRPKEITGESLQVTEQGKDKGAAKKLGQPRFKWRTIALLVPLAILNSRTLGARR